MTPDHENETELPEPSIGVLRTHRLRHLPVLHVGESMVLQRMRKTCDSTKCTSQCCGTGVYADRAEYARILAQAEVVRRAMDADQEKDETKWFDEGFVRDRDFPSGEAIGTTTGPRGCVFLNGELRCVLQKATMTGLTREVLKPFYCTAFPITIDHGVLSLDVDNVDGTPECCQPAPSGERTPIEAFPDELSYVLGTEALEELRALARARA